MTALISIKDQLKLFYAKAGFIILPLVRFVAAFCVFTYMNRQLGYMDLLTETYVVLVLSMICAILPSQGITVFGMLVMVGHSFSLHYVVAACVLVILLLILLLGLRFSSRHAAALVLTPIAYALHIPALVPLCLGLVGDIYSAFVSAGGVVLWYLIELVRNSAAPLCESEGVEILTLTQIIFQGIGQNQAMVIDVIAVMATAVLVAFVRRLHADYAWQLSVVFGGICYAFVILAGCLLLDLDAAILPLLAGTLVSMLLGLGLQFFLFGADYSATEFLQYEDDSYVYYVKAVPKYTTVQNRRPARTVAQERKAPVQESPEQPPVCEQNEQTESVDYENRLEESLKNL